MPQNIFGTDGVRGVANADLSCDLAFRLGRAATKFLGPDICIGRDTRLSGTMLESALTAGIMAEGGRPHCCGVIPTPAVALLTVQNELMAVLSSPLRTIRRSSTASSSLAARV